MSRTEPITSGRGAGGIDALEQRQELEPQRAASERKRLEDDGARRTSANVAKRMSRRARDRRRRWERNRRRAAA
jgi:hypothetical protein